MKLAIVSDSMLFKNIIKDIFKLNPSVSLIGEVSNWNTLLSRFDSLSPDIIISDAENIDLDTINSVSSLIVLVTKKNITVNKVNILYISKPDLLSFNDLDYRKNFFSTIKNFFDKMIDKQKKKNISYPKLSIFTQKDEYKVVLIGASTGGPKAIASVIKSLSEKFSLGIIVVQHIETGFDTGFANWLSNETGWKVRLAKNNDFPLKREVILAPTDKHLVFKEQRVFLNDGPKVLNQKPSVDVLFESAAMYLGKQVIAILLTGMGNDGADGCVKIKNSGGITLVQDKETSTIFGMPKAAIEKNGATHILPLYEIPIFLETLVP